MDTVVWQTRRFGTAAGFFSVEVAGQLTDGRLKLFDLQPEMLAQARRKLEPEGFSFRDSTGTIWQDIVRFDRLAG
jgi:predicted O-methyltransferase YrrM